MARTAMIVKEQRRAQICQRYRQKRLEIKNSLQQLMKNPEENFEEIQILQIKLQKQPRDASKIRKRSRCAITGRSRGVYRRMNLGRTKLRELAMRGEIPGITKSSW